MRELLFIIWIVASVILACSIVGLLLFIPKDTWQNADNTPSTWCSIGTRLVDDILND